MTYSMKDVDDAEALVLAERPGTLVFRDDFDWSLSIKDKDSNFAIILFQPLIPGVQREIRCTSEEIKDTCFWLGHQWTTEQFAKIKITQGR